MFSFIPHVVSPTPHLCTTPNFIQVHIFDVVRLVFVSESRHFSLPRACRRRFTCRLPHEQGVVAGAPPLLPPALALRREFGVPKLLADFHWACPTRDISFHRSKKIASPGFGSPNFRQDGYPPDGLDYSISIFTWTATTNSIPGAGPCTILINRPHALCRPRRSNVGVTS